MFALWTYLIVRLVAARSTLSNRTLLTYALAGWMIGIVALPLVDRLILPYGHELSADRLLALNFLRIVTLFAPVAVLLLSRRAHRVLSVADAFLLAFMVGFGFDFLCGFIALPTHADVANQLAFFPPFQLESAPAGYAYKLAFAGIILAATFRVARYKIFALIATSAALFFAALQGVAGPLKLDTGWIFAATIPGPMLVWTVLILLVAFSIAEWLWVGRRGHGSGIVREARERIGALLQRGLIRSHRLGYLFRLKRQIAIAETEVARGDRSLSPTLERLRAEAARCDHECTAQASSTKAGGGPISNPWREILCWVPLILCLYVPGLRFVAFLSIPVFIGVLIWRFVTAPANVRRGADIEDSVRFYGERTILRGVLDWFF